MLAGEDGLDREDLAVLLAPPDREGLLALVEAAGARARALYGRSVTYSRKVFIPLTRLCRDRCGYCSFVLGAEEGPAYMELDEVVALAEAGRRLGCKEALFTLGDRPEARYPHARSWLRDRGYESTIEYLERAAAIVLEETGLLPHLNPGVLSREEMERLRWVSVSMGLMLETTSRELLAPGGAHYGCPDKRPEVRLEMMKNAGELGIPFTSGLLLGIGETSLDRAESILALAALARRYGHLQEVIIQPFRAHPGTAMANWPEAPATEILAAVAVARLVLPSEVAVQVPPNLFPAREALEAGASDLGGISPLTPDYVNLEYPWPHLEALARELESAGFWLTERLALYPRFVLEEERWVPRPLRRYVRDLSDAIGFAREGERALGRISWAGPERKGVGARLQGGSWGAGVSQGSSGELLLAWGEEEDGRTRGGGSGGGIFLPPATWRVEEPRWDLLRGEVARALERALEGRRPTREEALLLFEARGKELEALLRVADEVRRRQVGEIVTYVVNRNLNFTNVCYTGCRFCGFARAEGEEGAYTHSLEAIAEKAAEAWEEGATEVCIQAGLNPNLPPTVYFDVLRAVKEAAPGIHIHAWSPFEVDWASRRLGISPRAFLARCLELGLGTFPGTAAEILDPEVRRVLSRNKLPAERWEEIVRTGHSLGLRSSSTIMFGHVDRPWHWVDHILRIRAIQEETGGFTEFVPLPFIWQRTPLYLAGLSRRGPTLRESLAMHAVARLLLGDLIPNIQVSWVKLGVEAAKLGLQAGANDFGGTLMEENISRLAGSEHGVRLEVDEIRKAVLSIGRVPAERNTDYSEIRPEGIRRRASPLTGA